MIINKIDDLEKIVNVLIKKINNTDFDGAVVVSLNGDLGTGKTTFTKKFAAFLGIKEEVVSPTFVISKEYNIPKNKYLEYSKFIHIDSYRLKDEKDLEFIGFNKSVKNKKNIIFIEWADIIKKGLSKNIIEMNFKYLDKNSRKIDF